jgi:hypothetical protein
VALSDTNTQYTDFTINSGITLNVSSGTIIRCTGTFTNKGIINVGTAALGATQPGVSGNTDVAYAPPLPGIALRSAGSGDLGANTVSQLGGAGGVGLGSTFQARLLMHPGIFGGGGGGGTLGIDGPAGGGTLVVLAKTAIVIGATGQIQANGANGNINGGGGGGGVIILASAGTITSNGTSTAIGGTGGPSDILGGAGGGGGGGLLHFIAPTVTVVGTTNSANGGAAGTAGAAGSVTSSPREGGGGGGGSIGNGGNGGNITANPGTPGTAGAGANGFLLFDSAIDPTSLF